MDHLTLVSICAVVSLQILVFVGGVFVGRMIGNNSDNGQYTSFSSKSNNSNNKKEKPNISIDSKTFVTDIKTEGMEKKFTNMTETTSTSIDISSSVNKLKNLKN
jgi:cytochrome c biogenesis protein ResB